MTLTYRFFSGHLLLDYQDLATSVEWNYGSHIQSQYAISSPGLPGKTESFAVCQCSCPVVFDIDKHESMMTGNVNPFRLGNVSGIIPARHPRVWEKYIYTSTEAVAFRNSMNGLHASRLFFSRPCCDSESVLFRVLQLILLGWNSLGILPTGAVVRMPLTATAAHAI